ncbi:TetR/AcrR family transcriptional regulator [Paeniglutamicibacter antarcticus]|uniref:TetR/AcrR family transcriptional regulator n=1 Tax=Arthrobacter terrae TaxID=2935737 RepID=A0A931CR34_9MICC|nr:TetR/AcrR family transcriptional regulator [Arthrobacter terrae]MBG0740601.1 TetR/AcrR family transcriptional regulator [Arthrobacter terrae]
MSAAAVDGRSARAQRTRQIIADAHIALINDGELRPSAKQIAARAGVSQRALWDNFKDMESLMAGTARQQLDRQDEAFISVEPDVSLPERIERYCRQRAALLESVAPLARAADLQRPFSPVLQENLRENLRRIRAAFEALFMKELAALAPGDRERFTLAACAAADWASWQLLRDQLGLGVEQAGEVLQLTLTALLTHVAGAAAQGATVPGTAPPTPPAPPGVTAPGATLREGAALSGPG